jgi:hypothetical protein
MIKVYNVKEILSDEERIKCLSIIKQFPNSVWTQSICTDEQVIQLRDFFPIYVLKRIHKVHEVMLPLIEKDFELSEKNISLEKPNYLDSKQDNIITVDKRIKGMSLSPHADIPTGTFTKHIGSESGKSRITISTIYYWNDDFEGGEVDFYENASALDIQPKIKPQNDLSVTYTYRPVAGDFIVFSSDIVHSIKEIQSGERLSTQYFYLRV